MESTFIIEQSELNENFLKSLKKLFRHSRQLQITVATAEDFGLLKKETPQQCLARLEKNMSDIRKKENTVTITESELDEIIFQKL